MLSDFLCVCVLKDILKKTFKQQKEKRFRSKSKARPICTCVFLICFSVACGIEFLPHLFESHELSSSLVNTISVCCWEFAPEKILLVSSVQRFVGHQKKSTIVNTVSLVGHCDALHEICVDNLTVGRWKESRRVNVASNKVVDIRNRFLFDRDDVLSAGRWVCGVQRGCCTLKGRFGKLLIWNCRYAS